MGKIDYRKLLGEFYQAKVDQQVTVNVPAMQYLMIDGRGDPDTARSEELIGVNYIF